MFINSVRFWWAGDWGTMDLDGHVRLHWAFIPIFLNNMAMQGFDLVMGLLLANQMAMAGAVVAVVYERKMIKRKHSHIQQV